MADKRAVLVTTQHRGVFFGYVENNNCPTEITLSRARNCVYWESALRGVFGLAAQGPSSQCRVGPQVEEQTLYDITSVSTVSTDAVEKWESGPWK